MRWFLSGSLLAVVMSCGPAPADVTPPAPAPAPDADYAAIEPVLKANCALSGCHAVGNGLPEFDTAAKFKASKAKAELTEGAMPPLPRRISAADKTKLLDYLK